MHVRTEGGRKEDRGLLRTGRKSKVSSGRLRNITSK